MIQGSDTGVGSAYHSILSLSGSDGFLIAGKREDFGPREMPVSRTLLLVCSACVCPLSYQDECTIGRLVRGTDPCTSGERVVADQGRCGASCACSPGSTPFGVEGVIGLFAASEALAFLVVAVLGMAVVPPCWACWSKRSKRGVPKRSSMMCVNLGMSALTPYIHLL